MHSAICAYARNQEEDLMCFKNKKIIVFKIFSLYIKKCIFRASDLTGILSVEKCRGILSVEVY